MLHTDSNSMSGQAQHNALIVDQFNRQAATFGKRHAQSDPLDRMMRVSGVTSTDSVLDVACGPGIVACRFAEVAHHVTGLDLAPGMLERAQALQAERSLRNLTWLRGDVSNLPFAENSFSIVVTRYTFHHFLSPASVLSEMVRVCRPGGRIVVADVTPEASKLAAYDEFETLRDPSHAHGLSAQGLQQLFSNAGLPSAETSSYDLEMDFEDLMSGSFPNPEDAERVWQLMREDVNVNRIGLNAHLKNGKHFLAFPITIMAANKPA